MKAIAIDDFAADPTMHDLPNPTPGAGRCSYAWRPAR